VAADDGTLGDLTQGDVAAPSSASDAPAPPSSADAEPNPAENPASPGNPTLTPIGAHHDAQA
ncbi:MAG: hypothetical protein ACTJGR_10215, partial [Pauljensenia sp.]